MPSESVVVGGRVDTSKAFPAGTTKAENAVAAGQGKRTATAEQMLGPMLSPQQDATKDADWATFERAEREATVGTPSRGALSDDALMGTLPPEIAALLRAGKPTASGGVAGPAGGQQVQTAPTAAQQPAPGAPAQPNAPPTAPSTQERVNALAAMKRDGWSDKTIQKLSDEELMEVGTQRHTAQAAVDSKLNERRAELREGAPATTTDGKTDATPASGGPGQTATLPSVKEAAKSFGDFLSSKLGEEFGEPGAKVFESALQASVAPLVQGLEVAFEFIEGAVARDVRREWKTEFPDAVKAENWDAIKKTQQQLFATGRYQGMEGIEAAWEHARRIHMPGAQPASVASRNAADEALLQQKSASGLTIGTRAPATGALGKDAEEFASFIRAEEMSRAATASLGYGPQ